MDAYMKEKKDRLTLARKKAMKQLRDDPESVDVPKWQTNVENYTIALDNIKKHGAPRPPTGNPVGVNIGVPKLG